MNLRFVADEVEGADFVAGLECAFGAFDDDPTTVVATHDIHCNSHNWPDAENGSSTPARELTPGCDAQNLASFIVAAGRADPMGDIRRGALGASAELRSEEHTSELQSRLHLV